MRYTLMVTGPAYGTQNASSALLFARAVLEKGHQINCVFFYGEGVNNANMLLCPANDEVNLLKEWQALHQKYGIALQVCVAAALRRGIVDHNEAAHHGLSGSNLSPVFQLVGLGSLAQAAVQSDRLVQF